MKENYFEVPTVENCYFAGLIATDGSIRDDLSRGRQKQLSIRLNEKDKFVLDNLHKELRLENNLLFKKPKLKQICGKESLTKPMYTLQCSSNKICSDLEKNWNIVPRKTYTLKPPNIKDKNLIKSFLIGVIDGDGSIYRPVADNRLCLSIVGASEEFLLWCKEKLALIGNVSECPRLYKRGNTYYFKYSSKKAINILSKLKEINVEKFERKWALVG